MEASAVPRVAPAGVAAFASPGLLRVLSDDRLVALIRDGDRNAFEAVYDRHYRSILSFCRHMLGCADEAEDVVQHTFLAAYNDLVASRKPIRLRAWLFTIARNRCLSILRARRERTVEFEEQATDGLAVQVQRRQDLRDLVVDINHLPDDQRAALVLAEMGALTHDEIGSVIGVPKDKVKALIFQARESLLADRAAREADCREIREQLSTMRGAALRRTTLRRHLRECQGCRDYRHELEGQKRRIAAILPVAPTFALRDAILGVTAGGGIAGVSVAGSGMLGASSVLKGLAGKALLAALLTFVGTTGTILVVHDLRLHAPVAPLRHTVGTATGVLGPTSAQLAAGSSSGSGASTASPLASGTGLGAVHQSAGANALVHALTGQLSNLLSPMWPHEKLVRPHGAAPHGGTQPPAAPPAAAMPAPATTAPSQPTVAAPSSPTGGSSGSRSPASGRSTGGSTRGGGPGPPTLSGQSGSSGSSAPASGAVQAPAGSPSGTSSGSSGSPTGSTGAGAASGPGPTSSPGTTTTPAPTSGPGPGPTSGPGPGSN